MTEQEQAQMDARAASQEQEQAEQEAKEAGYCYHCGAEIDDCPGYKCWK